MAPLSAEKANPVTLETAETTKTARSDHDILMLGYREQRASPRTNRMPAAAKNARARETDVRHHQRVPNTKPDG